MKFFAPALTVLVLTAQVTFSTHAAYTTVDMDLMQEIEEINDSLASNIALEKAEASLADARQLKELFVVVEGHYATLNEPNAEDALAISRDSLRLAGSIIDFVTQKDFESAANSATDLSRACRACHVFYRED